MLKYKQYKKLITLLFFIIIFLINKGKAQITDLAPVCSFSNFWKAKDIPIDIIATLTTSAPKLIEYDNNGNVYTIISEDDISSPLGFFTITKHDQNTGTAIWKKSYKRIFFTSTYAKILKVDKDGRT